MNIYISKANNIEKHEICINPVYQTLKHFGTLIGID